jgi:hypothetical protein
MVDQVSAHGTSSDGKKVAAVLPVAIFRVDQAEVDLVDKFRGLKGMPFALTSHKVMRDAAEIRHHPGEQLVLRLGTALTPAVQKLSDFAFLRHWAPDSVGIVARGFHEYYQKASLASSCLETPKKNGGRHSSCAAAAG